MSDNCKKVYYKTDYDSPIGRITLASDGEHLIGLWIEGQRHFLDSVTNEMFTNDGLDVFRDTKEWLNRYFDGKKPEISKLPLAPMGGEFRQTVWKMLIEIPYGEVITYGELARKIAKQRGGSKMSAQAVGGAVGHNPISIIIPCHRVVGANGNLVGYSGGLPLKVRLLKHEGVEMKQFYMPAKGGF